MKKFRLIITAMASMATISSMASAADLAPSVYDWNGFYLGVNAGAAWNDSEVRARVDSDDLDDIVAGELRDDLDADDVAFTGGALMGYNWQYESLVLGFETDFNYLGFNQNANRDLILDEGNLDLPVSTALTFEADWYGTIRARLGFAADSFLIYGTGGAAYGHFKASGSIDGGDPLDGGVGTWSGSVDDVNWGWTIGAGMEYALDESWILGAEYLYVDLGSANWNYQNDSELLATDGFGDVDYQFSVARMTVKYKF